MSSNPMSEPWWHGFHVIEMADLFLEREDQQQLAQTMQFLCDRLQLQSGQRIYDQCCGIGSLSISLAQQYDLHVDGADLCEPYVQRALGRAPASCRFVCADALQYVPAEPCDGVINWYSSFGYSHRDEENRQMLQRAFDALRAGGRLALDVPNFPALLRGFQRYMVRRGESGGRQVSCIRESQLNLTRGLLEQVWTWVIPGQQDMVRHSALRIYMPHQLVEMAVEVGFADVELYGSLDGKPLDMDSPRLILIARRLK